jgi:hypothetical protein
MKCDSCGAKTRINYGNANAVLCSNCTDIDEGKNMIATNSTSAEGRGKTQSDSLLAADYQTGILIAKAVSGIGWVTCFIALIIILMAFGSNGVIGALALAPGLGVLIGGLILVISGQTSRAIFDNTNYSRQILEEIRKKF